MKPDILTEVLLKETVILIGWLFSGVTTIDPTTLDSKQQFLLQAKTEDCCQRLAIYHRAQDGKTDLLRLQHAFGISRNQFV